MRDRLCGMAGNASRLTAAVEDYLAELRRVRDTGAATEERSYYPALSKLLDAVGGTLRPKVFSVIELGQQGAGHPDLGLFTAGQGQKGRSKQGRLPDCGVVEVKPAHDDAWLTADSAQVSRYWQRYRQVLVTNTRDFVLLGDDGQGNPARLETFRLAGSAAEFEERLQHPRAFANAVSPALAEYLRRVMTNPAKLAEPRDLARLMASYARDGLARVESSGDASSLNAVRAALEEALGVRFEGERGAAFFRSTLVQTLFYGVFSAWVLWARHSPAPSGPFDWRTAVWHLRAPVIRSLFQQLSDPGRLQPLNLVEVLDWTAAALGRVDRDAFFDKFDEGEAVQYFYEPFLEEFDPALRKQLGVWYTPAEVVRYMVARVDRALKDDLGIADGLAADNVYVLDPCCGTGAYLAETLKRIAANLDGKGLGSLAGARVKQAATQRVFGFEIMPAPFVVAHLQVGLTMQALDAALSDDGGERAGVFLTNALTGWEPAPQKPLPFPELEDERDRAERVKQDTPVLVILGNPPYNGFAGMAVDEERELSQAYRAVEKVRKPEGQGLNDLYVRFFRMAERRIAEKTGRGVVCFISNYSWLDGLSFTGMRERYLDAFDAIRIDNLHGDRIISEYAPDGRTSETVFAIQGQSPGIRIGTAITMLSKSGSVADGNGNGRILYKDFQQARAEERRTALLDSLDAPEINYGYEEFRPHVDIGLPFKPMAVNQQWSEWPSLPDLFPTSFPGVKTSRDSLVVDIDLYKLKARIENYFSSNSDVITVPDANGYIRYAYRPFDTRWLYWESNSGLLDRPRPDYKPHVFGGNLALVSQQKPRREWSPPQVISDIGCLDLMDRGATCIPMYLRDEQTEGQQGMLDGGGEGRRPNLSAAAQAYLDRLGLGVEELFHHALATLHDPAYRAANAGALRMEWPRIPLPGWPDGNAVLSPSGDTVLSLSKDAADELRASAQRGRELAALLDAETPVAGVTAGALRPELAAIAVPTTADGRNMAGDDFALTAGWGHHGSGDAVMPGQGRATEREYTAAEREALGDAAIAALGATTCDIHLNNNAHWRNVPTAVWYYKLGGYQVLKKWLSYREHKVLNRPLTPEEAQHFTDTARRVAALLALAGDVAFDNP